MTTNILVPIDFSDGTTAVLDEAERLAKAFDAKIWLIHVAAIVPDFDTYELLGTVHARLDLAEQLSGDHRTLQTYERALRRRGLKATAMLVSGTPARKILEEARRLEADLIVLGSHGHGALYGLLMGSVCQAVLRKALCPVVIVPSRVAARAAAEMSSVEP
jgi:nucleotide-binding universal stress UspA family protein